MFHFISRGFGIRCFGVSVAWDVKALGGKL